MRRRLPCVFLLAWLVTFGCSRGGTGTAVRLAILPANVLIADGSSEWMSPGVAIALVQDLATSHHFASVLANNESVAYQRGVAEILRTTVENRKGRMRLEATITDLATQQDRNVMTFEGPASAGALEAVNELARRIDPQAEQFSTSNSEAWQAYTASAGTRDAQDRRKLLETAIGDDPGFGLAYLVLAEIAGQNGEAGVIQEAEKHRAAFTALDRARLNSLMARASRAPLAEQAQTTQALLNLSPNDVDALTLLGWMRFLQNNASEGERLLKRALELSPDNLNIRAQLAEGLLESRRFADAEKLFRTLENDHAAVIPQLSVSMLLAGNAAGANTAFSDYLKERSAGNDPLLFLAEANWIAVSKQPADGVQFLAKNNFAQDDLKSLAASQSAIWQLMGKDSAGAKASAAMAMELANAPVPKLFGLIAALVTAGDADVAQWRERVNAAPLEEPVKQAVLAYGFFLNGRYAEAFPVWQKLVSESGDSDLRARAMLAGALQRLGRSDYARKLDVEPFAPNLTGADQFAVVTFDEMRRLLKLNRQ